VLSYRANSRIVDKQEVSGRATTWRGTRSITRSGDGLRSTLTILGILERGLRPMERADVKLLLAGLRESASARFSLLRAFVVQ
jgi:hypothetical protein